MPAQGLDALLRDLGGAPLADTLAQLDWVVGDRAQRRGLPVDMLHDRMRQPLRLDRAALGRPPPLVVPGERLHILDPQHLAHRDGDQPLAVPQVGRVEPRRHQRIGRRHRDHAALHDCSRAAFAAAASARSRVIRLRDAFSFFST